MVTAVSRGYEGSRSCRSEVCAGDGESEMESESVALKDLTTHEQRNVALDAVVAELTTTLL